VIIAGAAAAAAGGAVHAVSWRTRDRMIHAPDVDTYLADRRTFIVERNFAIGAYAVAGVTLATGLVLAYRAAHGRGDGAQLSAALVPGGAAIGVAWAR